MKNDLITLCDLIEADVPTARAIAVSELNQVIVTFVNRPDVEISLLTPWLQNQIKAHCLSEEDLHDLLLQLHRIANT